jgi:prophage antirepressor-like protein
MNTAVKVVPFAFEDELIRMVEIDGEPWFVARDVCGVLGIANSRDAVDKLDADEKADVGLTDTSSNGVAQQRTFQVVSESGLYAITLRCRDAMTPGTVPHRFRRWVTAEVLPSIRKTGRYEVPPVGGELRLGHPEFKTALDTVTEARRQHGRAAARALWKALGLPWVAEMDEDAAAPTQDIGGIGRFVAERLERQAGVVTPASVLWSAYLEWCAASGVAPATQTMFGLRLPAFGFRKLRGRTIAYGDVRLRTQAQAGAEG